MKDVCLLQAENTIAGEIVVNQQREINAGLFPEVARILHPAQSDRNHACASILYLLFPRAQLRHVLTAEDSAPVPQEDDDCRLLRPEPAQADHLAVDIRQFKRGESAAERVRHCDIVRDAADSVNEAVLPTYFVNVISAREQKVRL
jgi:hypothetical protein